MMTMMMMMMVMIMILNSCEVMMMMMEHNGAGSVVHQNTCAALLYKSAMVQRYKGQLQILLVKNIRLLLCKTVCKPAFLQDDAVRQVGY